MKAAEANRIANENIKTPSLFIESEMNLIYEAIKQVSNEGRKFTVYENTSKDIIDLMVKQLEEDGYKVNRGFFI